MPKSLVGASGAGLDGTDGMLMCKSTRKMWRDGFGGSALNPLEWDSSAGTGGSVSVSGGVLTLASGTTASNTVYAMADELFRLPVILTIGLSLSQRIANQQFFVEMVSVDPVTQQPDGLNAAAWLFDGTTATLAKYRAQIAGNTAVDSAASTITTTAGSGVYEIELRMDEAWYHAGTIDSTNGKTNSYRRQIGAPDPNALYRLRLRWLNGATPPASSTSALIQYIVVQDHDVVTTSVLQGEGPVAAGQALGVAVIGTPAVTISSGTVTSVTSANLSIPGIIIDVGSSALTSTSASATVVPSYGCSYEVNIPVTAVSGTSPTLDVVVQESDDSGTNWVDVYHFPRIVATGMYRSPKLPLTGNRVRYVQTVSGTTPSFTRGINRLQSSDSVNPPIRQLIDRSTIVLTTLASATPSLNTQGCSNVQLVVNIGAATTAPVLQLQGSDDNGATWYAVGSTLTAVANSTVELTVPNVYTSMLRAVVTSAGSGVTPGYVLLRAF